MASESWMVRGRDGALGPYTTEQLRSEIEAGRVKKTDFVSLNGSAPQPVIGWPQLQGIKSPEPFNWKLVQRAAMALVAAAVIGAGVWWWIHRPQPVAIDPRWAQIAELAQTWPDRDAGNAQEAFDAEDFVACEKRAANEVATAPNDKNVALFAECAAVANRSGLQLFRDRLQAALGAGFPVERAALMVTARRPPEEPLALLKDADLSRPRVRLLKARLLADSPEVPGLLQPLLPRNKEAFSLLEAWALESGELFVVSPMPASFARKVCAHDLAPEIATKWQPFHDAVVAKKYAEARGALGSPDESIEYKVYAAVLGALDGGAIPATYDPLNGFFAALDEKKLESLRRETLFDTLDGIAEPNPCHIPFVLDLLPLLAEKDPYLTELVHAWRKEPLKKRFPGSEGALIAAIAAEPKQALALLSKYLNDDEAPRAMKALYGRALEAAEPAIADDYWAKLVEEDDDYEDAAELHEARMLVQNGELDEARSHYKALYKNDKLRAPLEALRALSGAPK